MQLTDKDGNIFGTGGLEITTSSGKPKVPVINTDITIGVTSIVGGVAGRLLFDDAGVVGETNGVHWDKVNGRMGFGTVTPAYGISHIGNIGVAAIFSQRDFGFGAYSQITQRASYIAYTTDGTTGLAIGAASGAARIQGFNGLPATSDKPIFLQSLGGNVGIGTTTDAGFKFDVNGTGRFSNTLTIQTTATGGSPSNSILISTNDVGNGGRISWGDSNTSILRYSNSLYFREYTGNFVFESTSANAIYFSIRPWGTTLSAGPFTTNSSITAASAIARGAYFNNTLVAAANNDVLVGLDIQPIFTNGAFTGVTNYALRSAGSIRLQGNGFGIDMPFSSSFINMQSGTALFQKTYLSYTDGQKTTLNIGRYNDHNDGAVDLSTGIDIQWQKRQSSNISISYALNSRIRYTATSAGTLGQVRGYNISLVFDEGSTVNSPFIGYDISGAVKGTTGTISSFIGYQVTDNSVSSTIYGFRSLLNSGTGKWGLYFDGTANNYLAGNLLINTTTDAGYKLDVNGTTRMQGVVPVSTYVAQIINPTNSGAMWGLSVVGGNTDTARILNLANGTQNILTVKGNRSININSPAPTGNYATFFVGNAFSSYPTMVVRGNGSTSEITFQTQNSSGSALLTTLDNGNVLINTTTDAGYKLDVSGTAIIGDSFNYGTVFKVRTPGSGWNFDYQYLSLGNVLKLGLDRLELRVNNNTAYIGNNGDSSNASLTVMSGHDAAATSFAPIIFGSGRNASLTREVMRIDNQNKYVGIGTSTPSNTLDIVGGQLIKATADGFESIKLQNFANTYSNTISFYKSNGTTQTVVLGDNGASVAYPFMTGMRAEYGFVGNKNSGFHIFAGTNIAQTIHTTGNIGINTTTDAGYKLDVNGSGYFNSKVDLSANSPLTLGGGGNNLAGVSLWGTQNPSNGWDGWIGRNLEYNGTNYIYKTTNATNYWGTVAGIRILGAGNLALGFIARPATEQGSNIIATDLNTYTRLAILYNGNVGIGTTTPIYNLEINNSTGYVGVGIRSAQNNNAELIFQNAGYPTPRWTIRASAAANGSSGNLVFQRNASTFPMAITSGDNVLIGAPTDAGFKLDVNGSTRVQSGLTVSGSLNLNSSDISSAWTAYTPAWTSNGTQPSLGDGSIRGYYKIVGKTCFIRVRLALGTTSTGGTGHWLFSLPVPAVDPDTIQFACSMLDNGFAWYQGTVNGTYAGHTDKTAIIALSPGGTNSSEGVTATHPFTWGSTDSLQFNGSYEIA